MLIVMGQTAWALSQALLVIILAQSGGPKQVGLFVLGLSIFSPACLLFSFNLRMLIAVDDKATIDIRSAIKFRALSVILAFVATSVALGLIEGSLTDTWQLVTLLIASRAIDQSSDVVIGWYQSKNLMGKIAASFALRGVGLSFPILVAYMWNASLFVGAIFAFFGMAILYVIIDIAPLARSNIKAEKGPSLIIFLRGLGPGLKSAPYPLLDSLYANGFRYSISTLLGTETLGLVGIALSLYVPVQLLISAAGFGYLSKAQLLSQSVNVGGQRAHFIKSVFFSLFVGLLFLLCSASVPVNWLEFVFNVDGTKLRFALINVSLAMLFLPITGFAALNSVAKRQNFALFASALIGCIGFSFGVLLLGFDLGVPPTLPLISTLFAFFSVVRVLAILTFSHRDSDAGGLDENIK